MTKAQSVVTPQLKCHKEVFLCRTSSKQSSLLTQQLSSTADFGTIVVKLQSSVLLLDPISLRPCHTLHAIAPNTQGPSTPPTTTSSSSAIHGDDSLRGVAISPPGAHVVAYTSTCLFAAALRPADLSPGASPSLSQLQLSAELQGGIRSVTWCPSGGLLAVCCMKKPDVHLFALSRHTPQQQSGPHQHQQQQQAEQHSVIRHVQTLPGPKGCSWGPSAAAWLPHNPTSSSSSNSSSTTNSSSSRHSNTTAGSTADGWCTYSTTGLLVAWPLHLLLYTWPAAAAHTGDWGAFSSCEILTGWPGPVKSLLALNPGDQQQHQSTHQHSSTTHTAYAAVAADTPRGGCVTVVAAVDDEGVTCWGCTPQAAAQQQTVVNDDLMLQDSHDLTGVTLSVLQGSSSSSVLDSLMNISGRAEQPGPNTLGLTTGGLGSRRAACVDSLSSRAGCSSSTCQAAGDAARSAALLDTPAPTLRHPSALCQLTLDHSGAAAPSGREAGGGGHTAVAEIRAGGGVDCRVQGPDVAVSHQAGEVVSAQSSPMMLPLHQPLPRHLAACGHMVAVTSSTGAPLVTLCEAAHTHGLRELCTLPVEVPVAAAATAEGAQQHEQGGASEGTSAPGQPSSTTPSGSSIQVRVQGLLLLPAAISHVEGGGDAERVCSAGASSSSRRSMTDILVLVSCAQQAPNHVGSFKEVQKQSDLDLYLLKYRMQSSYQLAADSALPQQQQQQPQPQTPTRGQVHPSSSSDSSAVVAALQALQTSLESRLDALQNTLQSVEQRLAAVEHRASCPR